jgi:PhnB protein
MPRPDHYLPIMPYIIVEGAAGFIEFIEAALGAKELLIVPHTDGSIMHAEFGIGEGTIMFTECTGKYAPF